MLTGIILHGWSFYRTLFTITWLRVFLYISCYWCLFADIVGYFLIGERGYYVILCANCIWVFYCLCVCVLVLKAVSIFVDFCWLSYILPSFDILRAVHSSLIPILPNVRFVWLFWTVCLCSFGRYSRYIIRYCRFVASTVVKRMHHRRRAWALMLLAYTINIRIHSVIGWFCFKHRIVWIVCCFWLVSPLVTRISFSSDISFWWLIGLLQSYLIHLLSQTSNLLSMLYLWSLNLKFVIPFNFWNSFLLSFESQFQIFNL